MADEATKRALKNARRRRAAVPLVAGALLGVLLRATIQFDPARSGWLIFESWVTAVPTAEAWLRSSGFYQQWASWVSGPVLVMLALGALARTGVGSAALKRIVRDPPWFVSSCLDGERQRTMLNLEREPLPLVGRHDLLSDLDALASAGPSFAWRMVVGVTGIGKTRLGIEWLEKMRKRGWDVGVVRLAELHSLDGWQSRGPTALLVDDARRWWDNRLGQLLAYLADGSAVGRPVRVLVTDQSPLAIEMGLAEHRERMIEVHAGGPLRVLALSEEEVVAFQEQAGSPASDMVSSAAAGRPRAVLIMLRSARSDSYASALRLWVHQLLPGLMDDSVPFPLAVAGPLLLSSLAGPIPIAEVRRECGDIDTVPLAKFYDGADAAHLHELLPLLEPDDLALALVLQVLPRLDGERRSSLVERALSWNVSTVEDRLAALSEWQGDSWTSATPDSGEIRWLRWLQECFDEFAPDRVAAVQCEARRLLRSAQDASSADQQKASIDELCDLARSRPFDAEIRSIECQGLSIALGLCGAHGQFSAMEEWEGRLLKILSLRGKLESHSLNRSLISGIMAAADEYARARRVEDLKRWKGHLDRLAEGLSDTDRAEVRAELTGAYANLLHGMGLNRRPQELEEIGARIRDLAGKRISDLGAAAAAARACTHALCIYGQLGRVPDMKRWLAELFERAESSPFEAEPEIRLFEAAGISDAMGHFGHGRLFSELEVHGMRLLRLAADERFSNDVRFHLRQAEGASIAMKCYGEAGDCGSLARWGQLLNTLAEDARFEGDPDLRRRQLHGANSAVWAYGRAERYDEMLRWAEVGLSISTDRRFATSAVVQELASSLAVNVTNLAGAGRMFGEMEKWGAEVTRISEIPEFFDNFRIQESISQATGNIINRVARGGGDPRSFSRWMSFLARHAQHYPSHPGVQAVASTFSLSAKEQLLGHLPFGRVQHRSRVAAPAPSGGGGETEGHTEGF